MYEACEAATRALGEIGDPSALPHMIPLLKYYEVTVREAAAEALGKIGDSSTMTHLLPLLEDEASWVRKVTARALGKIGQQQKISVSVANAPKSVQGWAQARAQSLEVLIRSF